MSKRLLSLHRRAPSVEAKEALDAVLVAGVFDQQVCVLFREDGVLQLAEQQAEEEFADTIRSLPEYGIEAIYVCADSLQARQMTAENLLLTAKLLSTAEQGQLLNEQDMVLID